MLGADAEDDRAVLVRRQGRRAAGGQLAVELDVRLARGDPAARRCGAPPSPASMFIAGLPMKPVDEHVHRLLVELFGRRDLLELDPCA